MPVRARGYVPSMVDALIAGLVLVGTGLQARASLGELRATKRHVLDHWNTEDALVEESPILRRRSARRQVRALRDPDMDLEIRRLNAVLQSWVLLFTAAALALTASIV